MSQFIAYLFNVIAPVKLVTYDHQKICVVFDIIYIRTIVVKETCFSYLVWQVYSYKIKCLKLMYKYANVQIQDNEVKLCLLYLFK